MKITYGKFCQEQRDLLNQFYHWWSQHHANNPEKFPAELEPGEWDEQFHLYTGEGQ